VQVDEWEAWLEGPVTRKIKAMLADRRDEFRKARQDLHPGGFESAHKYFEQSLVLATVAETYNAIVDSLEADAYAELFEETE